MPTLTYDSQSFSWNGRRLWLVGVNLEYALLAPERWKQAIASLKQSGTSVMWLSRSNTLVPIYALSSEKVTRRKLTLFRGVYPYPFEQNTEDRDQILHDAEEELRARGAVEDGDLILLTIGEPIGKSGGTNTLKIVKVGEHRN